jgi:hypothetical protein
MDFINGLWKSPWGLSVIGALIVMWAMLGKDGVVAGVGFSGPDGTPWRVTAITLGFLLMFAGVVGWLWLSTRNNAPKADPLPIESIKITSSDVAGLRVRLSGHVFPKKSGVNVWILRQAQGGGGAGLSVSPGHATTDSDGQWSHTASLWESGPFVLNAVVTTDAYEALFRYFRRAFERATAIQQAANPEARPSLSGWPLLDSVPQPSVCASHTVTLTGTVK